MSSKKNKRRRVTVCKRTAFGMAIVGAVWKLSEWGLDFAVSMLF